VLTHSSESSNETGQAIHSKTSERAMALLVILLAVAALCAVLYLIPD
jgi:hypothetical protein